MIDSEWLVEMIDSDRACFVFVLNAINQIWIMIVN